jgi:hypothetical protein
MAKEAEEETLSEDEIARRRDEVVRRMLATPPKPKTPSKPKRVPRKVE